MVPQLGPVNVSGNPTYSRWSRRLLVVAVVALAGVALIVVGQGEGSIQSSRAEGVDDGGEGARWAATEPLYDSAPGAVKRSTVGRFGDITLHFESSPNSVALDAERVGSLGSVGLGGNPDALPAITYGYAVDSDSPPRFAYYFGITRSEVARIELVGYGAESVATVSHSSFPDLRFFVIEVVPMHDPTTESANLVGYTSEGERLTDTRAIVNAQRQGTPR